MTDAPRSLVITGASRGLGAHLCEAFKDTYHIYALSRSGTAPEGCSAIACDIGDASAVKSALRPVIKDKGLYGLINAAGIASMNLAITTPPETAEAIIRTNLLGTIHLCSALAKRFARNKNGRVINFSTIAVPLALKGESVYVASKAGVEGFSRSFAREMADFNTTVNVIAPGPIDTALIAGVPDANIDKIVRQQIIAKKFQPSDVADIAQFLLSPESHMISGQVINIGGA